MKLIKYASILLLTGFLVACGHGYEGEYQTKAGSENELINAFAGNVGSENVVIGTDFIESQGQRTEFDDVFVRESGGGEYLVFKNGDAEEAWEIIDDDTLQQNKGILTIKLVRVK